MPEFNSSKQIEYWKTSSISDLETCQILLDKGKILQGLFWCHLTIEKILKAHYVRCNNFFAPKTHNLFYLLEKTDLVITEEKRAFLGVLMAYQIEGRYPEYLPKVPDINVAKKYLKDTKELFNWLTIKL